DDKDRNPSVALCYSDDSFKAEYVLDIAKKGSWNIEKPKQPVKHVEIKKETLLKELNQIRNIFYNYDMNDAYLAMELDNLIQKLTSEYDTQYSYSTHRQQINAIISKCSVVSPKPYNNHHLIWNAIQSSGLGIYQDWLESGPCTDKEVLKDILPDYTNAMEMFKLAKNSDFVSVHNLSEIYADAETGKPVKTIEDLFSKEDKQKYPVIMEKKALGASELKIHAKLEDFSESTISNFKKLFELLQE
nr:hypothetical protein [Lachnospiraceae bacterium]